MTSTRPTLRVAAQIGDLLRQLVRVAAEAEAEERLHARFSPEARVLDSDGLVSAVRRNEDASTPGLEKALAELLPGARWLPEDLETAALPAGQWWVVDAVEGNVNHIHGMGDWCVSITLVQDEQPALTVVRQPVGPHRHRRHTVGLDAVPKGLLPARVSRATVDAAMLDEAETPHHLGSTVVPLER